MKMSQLECKGVILVDSKLENVLLLKNAKGLLSFPTKPNHFEKIVQDFKNKSGIDISRTNIGNDDGDNVRYFLGIVNDNTTIYELCKVFNIQSGLEWINYKETLNLDFIEMKDVIESAFKIFKAIPEEERCQTRNWRENLLNQFQDL